MNNLRIGIVGNGVVGSATAASYRGYVKEVLVYDIDPERSPNSFRDVLACNLIFICLPTPQVDGSLACNTGIIDKFFNDAWWLTDQRLVLRSTVPIGYTSKTAIERKLPNLIHSPEFLTARTAVYDAANPIRNIIGDPSSTEWSETAAVLHALYIDRFAGVPCYAMTSDESEAVKLFQNGFSAVKIAFFNEIYRLADKLDLRWEPIRGALLAGGWVNAMHTQVPGPDGKFGFGGSCLPKDAANLSQCMWDAHMPSYMVNAALERNQEDRPDEGANASR